MRRIISSSCLLVIIVLMFRCASEDSSIGCEDLYQAEAQNLLGEDRGFAELPLVISDVYNVDINKVTTNYYSEIGSRFTRSLIWTSDDYSYTALFQNDEFLSIQIYPISNSHNISLDKAISCLGKPNYFLMDSTLDPDKHAVELLYITGHIIRLTETSGGNQQNMNRSMQLDRIWITRSGELAEIIGNTTWGFLEDMDIYKRAWQPW